MLPTIRNPSTDLCVKEERHWRGAVPADNHVGGALYLCAPRLHCLRPHIHPQPGYAYAVHGEILFSQVTNNVAHQAVLDKARALINSQGRGISAGMY